MSTTNRRTTGDDGSGSETMSCCQRLGRSLALTKEGATPVNKRVIVCIFLSLFAGSFTITFMFPFLPALVLYLGYAEEDKGYYAGVIASSFFLGRVVASYFWGWLSDKKGRRVVILSNLGCLCVLTLLFGFTNNLWFAILDRFLTGVMNGVIGTAKVILYEISDNSNQAVHMICISVAWGCGSFLGPSISGFLASPVEKYPNTFDKDGIFGTFPFLLPCIVGSVLITLTTIIVYLYLPETHAELKKKPDKLLETEQSNQHTEHNVCAKCKLGFTDDAYVSGVAMSVENLYDGHVHTHSPFYRANSHQHLRTKSLIVKSKNNVIRDPIMEKGEINFNLVSHRRQSISVPDLRFVLQKVGAKNVNNAETLNEYAANSDKNGKVSENGTNQICYRCHERIPSDEVDDRVDDKQTEEKVKLSLYQKFLRSDFMILIKKRDVQKVMALYTLYSFAVIGYHEVFAVWASTDSYYDGLEFSTEKIGLAIGFVTLPTIVLQIIIFPKLEARYGAKLAFLGNSFVMMVIAALLPITHLIYDKPVKLWTCLTILLIPDRVCTVCCFCCVALFVNNSVKPAYAGSVNGIGITVAALARALAPTVGGSIFAWSITIGRKIGYPFDINCVFIMFSLVYMISLIVALSIPNRLNFQNKDRAYENPEIEESEKLITRSSSSSNQSESSDHCDDSKKEDNIV